MFPRPTPSCSMTNYPKTRGLEHLIQSLRVRIWKQLGWVILVSQEIAVGIWDGNAVIGIDGCWRIRVQALSQGCWWEGPAPGHMASP